MTPEDRKSLRELAERATPGPWVAGGEPDCGDAVVDMVHTDEPMGWLVAVAQGGGKGRPGVEANARYLASLSPERVRWLLDQADRADRLVRALEAEVETQRRERRFEVDTYIAAEAELRERVRVLEAERDDAERRASSYLTRESVANRDLASLRSKVQRVVEARRRPDFDFGHVPKGGCDKVAWTEKTGHYETNLPCSCGHDELTAAIDALADDSSPAPGGGPGGGT